MKNNMNSLSINTSQSPKARAITALLMMSCLCIMLACTRVYISHNLTYLFLVWNLFLAWVPLYFAFQVNENHWGKNRSHTLICIYGFFWMIFFPNAPYIITDLIHLDGRHQVPIWFDALLIFSFALTGLLTGYISLFFIHSILEQRFKKIIGWMAVSFMMLLSAYGIFLGRVLRFNSWDIFSRPFELMIDCFATLGNMQALKMTVIFFLFLIFSYYILHSIIYMNQNQIKNHDH
jgi:uncharacterized membrane protein